MLTQTYEFAQFCTENLTFQIKHQTLARTSAINLIAKFFLHRLTKVKCCYTLFAQMSPGITVQHDRTSKCLSSCTRCVPNFPAVIGDDLQSYRTGCGRKESSGMEKENKPTTPHRCPWTTFRFHQDGKKSSNYTDTSMRCEIFENCGSRARKA